MQTLRSLPILPLLLLLATAAPGAPPAAPAGRAELQRLVDRCVQALVTHDLSGLPLAPAVRVTENTAVIAPEDGLAVNAGEGPAGFRICALDPESGQAGFFGVLHELGAPVILALRVKVADGRITEMERVVARRLDAAAAANLVTARPGLVQPVPPAERTPRAEMLRIADAYFESIEHHDGNLAPFADDCERHENGVQTTTKPPPDPSRFGASPAEQVRLAMARIDACGVRTQMSCHVLDYITRIRPRRLLIVDEELGLVFAFPRFVHRGDVQTVEITGVPGVGRLSRPIGPFTLQAGEIFKIRAGRIHEIEAAGIALPYGIGTGWDG